MHTRRCCGAAKAPGQASVGRTGASLLTVVAAVAALSVFVFPSGLAAEDAATAYDEQPRFDEDSIESRVQAAVVEALMLYWAKGADAFDTITPEYASHTDMIYPFVLNATTLETVANGAYPNFAGAIPDTLTGADRPLERIMADMRRDGGTWAEYMASNPDTGLIQLKRSWLYLHDGYVFGSGHYLPESRVKYVVEDAVRLFESRGVEAFDIITPDVEVDAPTHLIGREEGRAAGLGANVVVHSADLYPFVLNATDWATVAHATIPSRVGTCCSYAIQHGDRPIEVIIEDLHRDKGTWVEYVFINPATDTTQLKRTWLYMHGDYIFGSGYYLQDSRVQSLVDEAIHLYAARGTAAFDAITPETADILALQSPFVLNGSTLKVVAHGIFPNLVDTKDQHLRAADRSVERIIEELQTQEGAWVWHMSRSPATQTDQLTRTYLSMHDGYIFGAGYSMPDSRVQSVVDEAIYTYKSNPDTVFDIVTSGDMNKMGIYPVIRNTTHVLAHGTLPQLVGVLPPATAIRSHDETWNAAVNGGGTAWSQYTFKSPYTGTEQIKRAWLSLHDNYLFVSTYTVADADARSAVDYAMFVYESNKENDAWIDKITPDGPVITDDLYPFVINLTSWTRLADGVLPERVGAGETILDTSTVPMAEVIAELEENGRVWATYTFDNPAIRADQLKRSYLELRDGLVFGSGYYVLDSQVQSIAYGWVLTYDSVGRDAALARINTVPEEAVSKYLFVADPQTGNALAQGADTNLLNVSDWEAISLQLSVAELLKTMDAEAGAWANYMLTNPVTGEVENKRAWLILHDGLVFGSGYYSSDSTS